MPRIIDRLILAAFLFHVVFGCCLHHEHGSAYGAAPASVEPRPCCGDHRLPQPTHSEPTEPKHHGCTADQCVFDKVESVSVAELSGTADGVISGSASIDLARSETTTGDIQRLQFCGRPVRLHLINQAFLL